METMRKLAVDATGRVRVRFCITVKLIPVTFGVRVRVQVTIHIPMSLVNYFISFIFILARM